MIYTIKAKPHYFLTRLNKQNGNREWLCEITYNDYTYEEGYGWEEVPELVKTLWESTGVYYADLDMYPEDITSGLTHEVTEFIEYSGDTFNDQ